MILATSRTHKSSMPSILYAYVRVVCIFTLRVVVVQYSYELVSGMHFLFICIYERNVKYLNGSYAIRYAVAAASWLVSMADSSLHHSTQRSVIAQSRLATRRFHTSKTSPIPCSTRGQREGSSGR